MTNNEVLVAFATITCCFIGIWLAVTLSVNISGCG
jgi:hypothetical protein